jgi:hypothetical protein
MHQAQIILSAAMLLLGSAAQATDIAKGWPFQQGSVRDPAPQSLQPSTAAVSQPQTCGPDTAPTQAAAKGYTCEAFKGDPFDISKVDVNNTGNPGFTWYVNMNWVRSSEQGWQSLGIDSPGDVVVTANNLVMQPAGVTRSATHAGSIFTCNPIAAAPYFQGQYFTGGFYLEGTLSWTGPGDNSEGAWPIIWFWPLESLIAGGISAQVYFVELDDIESCCGRNVNTWWHPPNATSSTLYADPNGSGRAHTSGHKYGVLLWKPASGGSVGGYQLDFYLDDTFYATLPANTNLPAWAQDAAHDPLVILWNQRNCLLVDGAHASPATYSMLRVWQAVLPSTSTPAGGTRGLRRR